MSEPQSAELALAGRWDNSVLEPLAEINEDVVEALIGADDAVGPPLGGLRWRWQALGAPARRRLVRCPYLLLDAGFAQAQLWAALPRASVHELPPAREFTTRLRPMPTSLIRRVLLLAWHLARANRLTARLALGMSGECAQLLARCRLADLDWYAEQRPAFIRPRWEHRPALWHALMVAAALEQTRELERLHSWGLQMLAAETLNSTPAAVTFGARLR